MNHIAAREVRHQIADGILSALAAGRLVLVGGEPLDQRRGTPVHVYQNGSIAFAFRARTTSGTRLDTYKVDRDLPTIEIK